MIVFAGTGCIPAQHTYVSPSATFPDVSEPVSTTPVATAASNPSETKSLGVVSTKPAEWKTYTYPTLGFSLKYPSKNAVDLLKIPVDLPDPTGNKSPNVSVHVIEKGKNLDVDGCLVSQLSEPKSKKQFFLPGNVPTCETMMEEGAAGNIYRTQDDTFVLGDKVVVIEFILRYPTSVREYAGCEDVTESKPKCKELAFDEVRDTAIFTQILSTFQIKK